MVLNMSNENKVEVQFGADATGVQDGAKQAADSIAQAVQSIKSTLEGIRSDMSAGLKLNTSAFDDLAAKARTSGQGATRSIEDATSEMKSSLDQMRTDFGKGFKINGTEDLTRMKSEAASVFRETRTAAEQYRAKLAELDAMYKHGAIDAETYSRAVDRTKASFERANEGTSVWSRGLGQLKVMALGFLSLRLGEQALSIMADFEQLEVALTGLYGSQEKGKQAFAWIKQFAVDTPFEVRDVAHAFQTLKSYGIDPTNGSLRAIADMSARTGRGTQGLESATLALGQAWTRTKLQGQDILQMVNVGIPVWDILAQKTGKNTSELMKMSEKGQLGRDAIMALMQGMEEMAGGAAQAQMDTLSGKWSNFKDAIANSLDEMREEGATDGLKSGIEELTNFIPPLANTFMAMGETIGSVFTSIVDVWSELTDAISDGVGQQVGLWDMLRGVLEVIRWGFIGLKSAVQVVFETLGFAVENFINGVKTLAGVLKAALSLDWDGVKSAYSQGFQTMEDLAVKHGQNIVKKLSANREEMLKFSAMYPDAGKGPKIDTSSHINAKTGNALIDKATGTKQTSRVGQWSAELAEEKVYYQQSNDLREYSKQQELAYWQEVLSKNKVTAAEKVQITRTMANLQLQILKEQKQREGQLTLEGINNTEKLGMDSVAMAEQHAQALVQAGQITQEKLLIMQQQFEDRKFKIMADAQQRRIDLLKKDPNSDPVALQKALDKLQEIQRKHTQTMAKLQDDVLVNSKQQWEKVLQPFSQAFDQSISGMIQGTQTLQQAMANIGQAVVAEFVNMGVKMATHWAATELAKTAATVEGTATRTAVEQAGANQSIAISAFAAIKSIMNSAWEAMAGAFKALVGIPVVGPALATGAGAAAFATVSGLAGNVASARGGFNIPAGVNPLTQLHEKEMVLPAHIADPMRDMLAGGGGKGSAVHIHAKSDKDMVRVGDLKKLLGQMNRNFVHIKD